MDELHNVEDLCLQSVLADELGISKSWLNNLIRKRSSNGFPEPKETLGRYDFYSLKEVKHWYSLYQKIIQNMNQGRRLNGGKRTAS